MKNHTKLLGLFIWLQWIPNIQSQNSLFEGIPSGNERIVSSDHSMELRLIQLVNQFRRTRGLSTLKTDSSLTFSSRYHAADMANDNYFDHQTHDRSGKQLNQLCSVFERIDKFTKQTSIYARAENIAEGQISANQVMYVWKRSRTHRRNMLIKDLKYIGVAFIRSNDSKYPTYWVQNFGSV